LIDNWQQQQMSCWRRSASSISRRTSRPRSADRRAFWWPSSRTACRPTWPGAPRCYGGFTGLLPIGWIVLNIIFLHQLTERKGYFKVLQESITGITVDRRLQLLLVAFSLRRLLRGRRRLRHAGGGDRRHADRPRLLAAGRLRPVADRQHGAGRLRRARLPGDRAGRRHRLDLLQLSGMIGRQLPFFSCWCRSG
jgi:lactate permease